MAAGDRLDASEPREPKRRLARLSLSIAATLLSLLVIEGVLRLTPHFFNTLRGGQRAATTILCLGDSHTYGLHVLPPLSYPSHLQTELDHSAQKIGVLNYGVPGRNSFALLDEIPRYLREVNPDLVLLLVGYNDSWNFDGNSHTSAKSEGILPNLRIVRMARLLSLRLRGKDPAPPPDVIERDGTMLVVEGGSETRIGLGGPEYGVRAGEQLKRGLSSNMNRIVELVKESGAVPVLLTYATNAQEPFRTANAVARETSAHQGVTLIDLEDAFQAVANGREQLFFDDDHPNAKGNSLIASTISASLLREGLVIPPLETEAESGARVHPVLQVIRQTETGIALLVSGTPERDFQIVLSPSEGPPMSEFGLQIPMGYDPLIGRCLESQNLRGRTDINGSAQVNISRAFVSDHLGTRLFAILAVFPPSVTEDRQPAISDRIEITP